MDNHLINDICALVYRAHPEIKGSKPKVQPYNDTGHLFIFQSKTKTENGRELTHTIRVVVDAQGKIKKMTASK